MLKIKLFNLFIACFKFIVAMLFLILKTQLVKEPHQIKFQNSLNDLNNEYNELNYIIDKLKNELDDLKD